MKDIKSLYLTAKTSGNNDEIASYTEAVNELLENKPNDFLLNLEYIISSDIGLPKLDKFVEKYGLSIGSYDDIITCLESCIKKCNNKKIDSSKYEECKKKFESFKEKYKNCFMMFEYFKDNISDEYMNTYYEFNQNGIQNSKLIKGMVEKYGESAIPDILITADNIGEDSVTQALKFLESYNSIPTYYQWIVEATHDITIHGDDSLNYIKEMHDKSLEGIYDTLKSRNDIIMREAVIMGNDPVFEYSEDEVDALVNLISFKEYQLTCTESSEEALKLQNEIYSLYEEFDNLKDDLKDEIKEDTASSIIPMLPNANSGNSTELHEDMTWMNTRNKKTGDAPGYLQKNHNLGYGEDDDLNIPKEHEPTLDDFKRSSVTDNTNNEDIGDDDSDLDKDNEVGAKLTPDEQRAINNYYYYTYNNSLNKNANSFNKTNSDDHSVDNSVDNSHKSDDHSTEKHVNSHNGNTDDHHNDIVNHKESSNDPTALNILPTNNLYTEEVGDADNMKPESDHPIKDALMDIDQKRVKTQQEVKKKVQDIQNAGRAFMKPAKRTKEWVTNMINDWKDKDENEVKEKMADPRARKNIFTAIGWAIKTGSLAKAGLLLNPVFLFLTITKKVSNNKNEYRIRNEMIGELKTEIEIIDEKIEDARRNGDNKAKYQLMRLKNEINKKLVRVSGSISNKKWMNGDII